MFRPQTGHHQVVHPMKRGWGLYNVQFNFRSDIVYCTAPNPLSLDEQPDDGLLETETCSC
jgi:hypothetical protein